jgi:SAM-dependent methyltransferase/uncharacterized protein YbaR (Trm112 family)
MNLSLVCPGCRTFSEERIELRTLERVGEVMRCECGRRYPVVDGVPIVMAEVAGFVRNEMAAIVEGQVGMEVQQLLVAGGPDDGAYARLVEHLSIYLDAQWGDRAEPEPDGVRFGMEALIEKVRERTARVELAVELGCSVGRVTAEMRRAADEVIGVDLHMGSLKRARRLCAGESVAYNRRVIGRNYRPAKIDGASVGVSFVCGDALDPPLVPGAFGRVVALNLLNSVSRPRQLLRVMSGLCTRGGELILSAPYAWQSTVMDEDERLGTDDPAAAVAAILRDGSLGATFEIEEEAEVPWDLRRDARSVVSYRAHYLRARKL